MLIALLQNNQQQPAQELPARLPTVFVDRGGGGPLGPRYDIVDILGAIESFQEVPGEHPVARAARRTRHLQQHLEGLRERRERREGAAFLAGASLAQSAAQDQIAAMLQTQEDLRAQLAASQAAAMAIPSRGGGGIGAGGALLLLAAGVAIGVAIARKKR